jgi:hypothetical protein
MRKKSVVYINTAFVKFLFTSLLLPAMKPFRLFSLLFGLFSFGFTFSATLEDTQILEALTQKQQEELLQQAKTLNEKISFTQVNSCQSMESAFADFVKMYKKYYPEQHYPIYA